MFLDFVGKLYSHNYKCCLIFQLSLSQCVNKTLKTYLIFVSEQNENVFISKKNKRETNQLNLGVEDREEGGGSEGSLISSCIVGIIQSYLKLTQQEIEAIEVTK